MAKRFTDSDKWKDAWFMDLPSKYKLFWIYLLDECDHAGVWKVNFKIATFYVGENLEPSEVKRILSTRIKYLNDEYWHIKKFIKYQYKCDIKDLNPKNKVHFSVLKKLNEYIEFKPLTSPLLGAKDKDEDKDEYNNTPIKEIPVDLTEDPIFKIKQLSDRFTQELKDGKHDLAIEQIYMRLKIRKGSLKKVLEDFKGQLIIDQKLHKNIKELLSHFNNYCNMQEKVGKLDEYKTTKKAGAL